LQHFWQFFGNVGELCRYLLDTPPSSYDRNHQLTKMIGNGLRPIC